MQVSFTAVVRGVRKGRADGILDLLAGRPSTSLGLTSGFFRAFAFCPPDPTSRRTNLLSFVTVRVVHGAYRLLPTRCRDRPATSAPTPDRPSRTQITTSSNSSRDAPFSATVRRRTPRRRPHPRPARLPQLPPPPPHLATTHVPFTRSPPSRSRTTPPRRTRTRATLPDSFAAVSEASDMTR